MIDCCFLTTENSKKSYQSLSNTYSAFIKYHTNKNFLELIKKKFGLQAVNNIIEMTKTKLKRKIKGD